MILRDNQLDMFGDSGSILVTVPEDYQREDWIKLYELALMELEEAKVTGRIDTARMAIVTRVEKLKTLPGLHPHESTAIDDALRRLIFLEREAARIDAEVGRRVVEESLQKLRSVYQSIQWLSHRPDPV